MPVAKASHPQAPPSPHPVLYQPASCTGWA